MEEKDKENNEIPKPLTALELMRATKTEKDKVPDYADLMTLDDWLRSCQSGGFIDFDGHGYYSDGEYEYDFVRPSHVVSYDQEKNYDFPLKEDNIKREFSHIAWYNR